ncbi:MAG TPA: hypothetical protein VM124_04025, partial [Candidatus Limnocylindrales bacterium]|nr:hypothetical protein [Candidatus Limnocylindrales bacterium]
NPKLGDALMQLSAAKFGKPRAVVDADITERMKTIEVPKPAFGGAGAASPFNNYPAANRPAGASPFASAGAAPAARPPASSGSSFLDEWLAKRRTGSPMSAPASPFGPPAVPNAQPFQPAAAGGASATNPLSPPPSSTPAYPPAAMPTAAPQATGALQSPMTPSTPAVSAPNAQASSQSEPKTTGEFVIPKPQDPVPSGASAVPEDTIYIDRDGNLRTNDTP